MKARVNDNCNGSGVCADTCPEVFELGPDGLAKVKCDVVPKEAEARCREAGENCPFQAIEVED